MKMMANQNGFTYILALTIVMIMGIMLGMVGQSWKSIKQREQEKELLFRGSQIKEAIENWNNPKYTIPGVQRAPQVHPLMDLKDLLQDPYSPSKMHFLPQNYAAELDEKNPKCAPDCAKLKIYQDPMTGKEWTIIRGSALGGIITPTTATQGGGIIGVASKSDETPFRTDFKETALENIKSAGVVTTPLMAGSVPLGGGKTGDELSDNYRQWKFIAETDPTKNDHSKIYRAYHESW
jgi:type II secretory pathway pseudopilin PulG